MLIRRRGDGKRQERETFLKIWRGEGAAELTASPLPSLLLSVPLVSLIVRGYTQPGPPAHVRPAGIAD